MPNRHTLLDPSVGPILRPLMPALVISAIGATLSGLSSLGALWQIVRMIDRPGLSPALWAGSAWILAALLAAGSAWLSHAAEGRFEAAVRREVGGRVARLPSDRLGALSTDRLRRLVSDDVAALHHMVAHLPGELATLIVIPLCAVLLLLFLAGPLSLVALAPGILAAVVYLGVIPRLSARYGAQRGLIMGEITSAVDDYAHGIHLYRTAGAASGALAEYTGATRRFTAGMLAWVSRVATPAAVATAFLQAVASYAIAYAVSGGGEPAVLAATLLLSLALVTPALRLAHGLDYVAAGKAAAVRIGGLLREPIISGGSSALCGTGTEVVVTDVSVRIDGQLLLTSFDAHAPAGSLTAVTGPSGIGKSTLLRIIAGLQRPQGGTVRVGGVEVTELRESDRSEGILLIPQSGDALPDSLAKNLRLVAPDADDAACAAALSRAQLPLPLDCDAARLSGGEKQRLSLARAFLSPAPVVLLDEPTSALDDATARRVWEEFEACAREKGRTFIVITHDPALAASADHVISLTWPDETGEPGTHESTLGAFEPGTHAETTAADTQEGC